MISTLGSRTQRRRRSISQPTPMPQTISPATMAANSAVAAPSENDADADGGDREAIKNEGGGVIGQSFALENDEEAPRQLHPAGDRQRRHRVGWRDDGAQYEADRPWKAQQPVRRRGDGGRREHHATQGQQRYRAKVEAEFAPAHRDGGGIDDRRQHEQQDEIGRQLQRRQPGNEREPDAGDDQQDRRGNLQSRRGDRDSGNHREKHDQNLERVGHVRAAVTFDDRA